MISILKESKSKPLDVVVFLFIGIIFLVSSQKENASAYNLMRVVIAVSFTVVISLRRQIIIYKNLVNIFFFFVWGALSLTWSVSAPRTDVIKNLFLNYILLFLFIQYLGESINRIKICIVAFAFAGIIVVVKILTAIDLTTITERIFLEGFNINDVGLTLVFSGMCFFYLYEVTQKKYCLILSIVCMGTSLLSGSKKILFDILIFLFLSAFWNKSFSPKYLARIMVFLFFSFAMVFLVFNNEYLYAIIGKRTKEFIDAALGASEYNASDTIRSNLIEYGIELFKQYPMKGVGIANSELLNEYGMYAHSNYIEMLANVGIIGCILFYLPYVDSAKQMIRYKKSKKSEIKLAIITTVIFIVSDFFMVSYYDLPKIIIFNFVYVILTQNNEKMLWHFKW